MSVQYACSMAVCRTSITPTECAARGGQNGCSAWLGPVGNSTTRVIRLSAPSINSTVNVQFFGMCTDGSDRTSAMAIANDGGSITPKNFTRPGSWGSPNDSSESITSIDVAKFVTDASVTTNANGTKTYYRAIGIGRGHSDAASFGGERAWIYITIGGDAPDTPPEPEQPLCSTWGSLSGGSTSTIIKIKNADLYARSGGVGELWNDTVYAKPTDRVAWHTCYYPGVQTEAFKVVSKVTGDYAWNGYTEVATDRCELSVHHVEEKQLYQAISPNWHNNYMLSNSVGFDGRSPSGASMGGQAPGGDYAAGDTTIRESENEINTLVTDVRISDNKVVETSTTSSPINAVVGAATLSPVSIYGGSCYKTVDNVNKTKLDGSNVYPVCPSTAIFKDSTTGAYFDSNYPDILGKVPEVPATATTPKVDAYNCWKPISGKAKNCQDCFGDKACMDNLGCNTCNGNSDCTENCCTCNDNYNCLQCTNTYDKTNIQVANLKKGPVSKNASVVIPYNYKLDTGVEIDTTHTVYAGETVKIKDFWVDILTRYNGETYDDYATIVPSAKYALVSYVTKDPSGLTAGSESDGKFGNLCDEVSKQISDDEKKPKQCLQLVEKDGGELNSSGSLVGNPHESHLKEIGGEIQNAFDASAGDYLCMVSAVWPTESKNDTDTGSGGNNKSRFSAPSCVQIAKKPSFQVWGAGMYSNGGITVDIEKKNNVFVNYYNNNWKIGSNFKTIGGNATYFGSWVDQGLVIGNGLTTTVASGAALGNTNTKIQTGNSGNICSWSPLTFANSSCGLSGVGNSGIGSGVSINREELIDYWLGTNGGTANVGNGGTVNLSGDVGTEINTSTGVRVRYIKSDGGLTISGGSVSGSTTYLVKAAGTLTIDDNIKYGGSYSSLASIPKVVIYANNVSINCNVTEVDAVIVTGSGGSVNTCYDAKIDMSDINDEKRSRQLKIFGTVITDSVTLGRTYGNAAWSGGGANGQKEAAEIFDYDSSILMWSEYMAGAAETDTLQTVYQHELAPRY